MEADKQQETSKLYRIPAINIFYLIGTRLQHTSGRSQSLPIVGSHVLGAWQSVGYSNVFPYGTANIGCIFQYLVIVGQKKRSINKLSVTAIPWCPCIAWTRETSSGTKARGIAITGLCLLSLWFHIKSLLSCRYFVITYYSNGSGLSWIDFYVVPISATRVSISLYANGRYLSHLRKRNLLPHLSGRTAGYISNDRHDIVKVHSTVKRFLSEGLTFTSVCAEFSASWSRCGTSLLTWSLRLSDCSSNSY